MKGRIAEVKDDVKRDVPVFKLDGIPYSCDGVQECRRCQSTDTAGGTQMRTVLTSHFSRVKSLHAFLKVPDFKLL